MQGQTLVNLDFRSIWFIAGRPFTLHRYELGEVRIKLEPIGITGQTTLTIAGAVLGFACSRKRPRTFGSVEVEVRAQPQ